MLRHWVHGLGSPRNRHLWQLCLFMYMQVWLDGYLPLHQATLATQHLTQADSGQLKNTCLTVYIEYSTYIQYIQTYEYKTLHTNTTVVQNISRYLLLSYWLKIIIGWSLLSVIHICTYLVVNHVIWSIFLFFLTVKNHLSNLEQKALTAD
jgi:hypothetical protein